MPPRFAYWTIIVEGKPTAFRAQDRDELVPTFKQLQSKHPDAVMMWFARGRLWPSPEDARGRAPQRSRAAEQGVAAWWRASRSARALRDPRDEKRRRFAERMRRDAREGSGEPESKGPEWRPKPASAPPRQEHRGGEWRRRSRTGRKSRANLAVSDSPSKVVAIDRAVRNAAIGIGCREAWLETKAPGKSRRTAPVRESRGSPAARRSRVPSTAPGREPRRKTMAAKETGLETEAARGSWPETRMEAEAARGSWAETRMEAEAARLVARNPNGGRRHPRLVARNPNGDRSRPRLVTRNPRMEAEAARARGRKPEWRPKPPGARGPKSGGGGQGRPSGFRRADPVGAGPEAEDLVASLPAVAGAAAAHDIAHTVLFQSTSVGPETRATILESLTRAIVNARRSAPAASAAVFGTAFPDTNSRCARTISAWCCSSSTIDGLRAYTDTPRRHRSFFTSAASRWRRLGGPRRGSPTAVGPGLWTRPRPRSLVGRTLR